MLTPAHGYSVVSSTTFVSVERRMRLLKILELVLTTVDKDVECRIYDDPTYVVTIWLGRYEKSVQFRIPVAEIESDLYFDSPRQTLIPVLKPEGTFRIGRLLTEAATKL